MTMTPGLVARIYVGFWVGYVGMLYSHHVVRSLSIYSYDQKPCGSTTSCGSGTFVIPKRMYIWQVLQIRSNSGFIGGARLQSGYSLIMSLLLI
jgi:hypothetical protein